MIFKSKYTKYLLAVLLLLILSFNSLVKLATDFLWFKSVNFTQTFLVRIYTKVFLFIPLWLIFGLFIVFYLKSIYKSYSNVPGRYNLELSEKFVKNNINLIGLVVGGLVSFGITSALWLDILKMINAVSFGKLDPIYNLDMSFYVFILPFLMDAIQFVLGFLGILILGTGLLDFIVLSNEGSINEDVIYLNASFKQVNNDFMKALLKKISILIAICFALASVLFYLNTFQLLYSARGVAFGASYTDINVTLWAYRTYSVLALLSSVLITIAYYKKSLKLAVSGPLLLAAALVLFNVSGLVVQQLIVEPDEISKEKEYLVYNIEHTQEAFNLDEVSFVDFPYEENLTKEIIASNNETIKNIRINDARPLKQTFNQIQGIRLYYDFYDIDIDRYTIDGEYTQVFISPREMDQTKFDTKSRTWLNQHIKYTHGHGIVLSPVNTVTSEGQPELLFKNIPPVTTTDLVLNQPELYFGEQADRYVVINTDEKEFDYPSGSNNVETEYSGVDGIKLNTFTKGLFSIRERSFKLLVSNNINSESKIIINRNIVKRVNEIAPFLKYDSNPYIVLSESDGKLYWIIDAYTTSKYYPYSQTFQFKDDKVNYIRNSVKVVIDAYNGTVKFYIYDEDDPIINTYSEIFPDLFEAKSDFPADLIGHVKYPQDFFDTQATVYRSYHVDNPVVFYNGEDVWDIATEKYMDSVQTAPSNYVMFKIDEKAEFALILPYTPKGKPNMTSLLVARNDAEHYGEVFMYRFPKDKTIHGPIMIESRIDQDSTISPQFTLWGQQGSRVLRGNIIIVPIESSLLYVEPIYLQADNKESLPEMKQVIVAYKDQIVMERTLTLALARLFGEEEIFKEIKNDVEGLLDQISTKFELTKESLDELQELIDELREKID